MKLSAEKEWYGYSIDTGLNAGGGETYHIRVIKKAGKLTVHMPPMHEYAYLNYMSPADAERLADALRWTVEFCRKIETEATS